MRAGGNGDGEEARRAPLAPLLETWISKDLFNDGYTPNSNGIIQAPLDETSGLGAKTAVVIFNPSKYTIHQDEDDVPSANDDKNALHPDAELQSSLNNSDQESSDEEEVKEEMHAN